MGTPQTLLLLMILGSVLARDSRSRWDETEEILKTIFAKYDRNTRARPFKNSSDPVVVETSMFIRYADPFQDLTKHTVKHQITLRQSWVDHRLKYHSAGGNVKLITLNNHDRVWVPDTFFKNEIKSSFHDVPTPNTYIRIFPDGRVLWSLKLTVTTYSSLNMMKYPFDTQSSSIELASYAWTNDDIVYKWDDHMSSANSYKKIMTSLDHLVDTSTDQYDIIHNTGSYSCLSVTMHFKRCSLPIIVKAYVPVATLVIVAWLALWMHPSINEIARLLVTGGCLVGAQTISMTGPQVNYFTMYDSWMVSCKVFIFCSVLVTVIVIVLKRFQGSTQAVDEKSENSIVKKFPSAFSTFHVVDLVAIPTYALLFLVFVVAHCASD